MLVFAGGGGRIINGVLKGDSYINDRYMDRGPIMIKCKLDLINLFKLLQ